MPKPMVHPLNRWIEQAREHWAEYTPRRYKALLKAGTLEKALQEAAERTSQEMQQLQERGRTYDEAWEIVRQTYLFSPGGEAPAGEGRRGDAGESGVRGHEGTDPTGTGRGRGRVNYLISAAILSSAKAKVEKFNNALALCAITGRHGFSHGSRRTNR
jgi:hypothetical protein